MSAHNARDPGSIPELGRSPAEGNGTPLQYFGHLMQRDDSLEKDPDAGRDWGQEENRTTEEKMAGWHH